MKANLPERHESLKIVKVKLSNSQKQNSDDSLQKRINDLRNRIYTTRKCRIIASERCKKTELKIFLLNAEYSVWLIVTSLIYLTNTTSLDKNTISIISSILVFSFTMLSYTLDYKGKYYAFKYSYIQLQELLNKIDNIEITNKNANSTLNEIYSNYIGVLNSTENHNEIDYYKLVLRDTYFSEKIDKLEILKMKWKVIKCKILNFVLITILAFIPFIINELIGLLTLLLTK